MAKANLLATVSLPDTGSLLVHLVPELLWLAYARKSIFMTGLSQAQ